MQCSGLEEQYPATAGLITNMKFSVYVLLNDRGKYYIGHTNNISRRIDQHNDSNRKSWASKYGPWKLIYHEICQERSEAVRKENI